MKVLKANQTNVVDVNLWPWDERTKNYLSMCKTANLYVSPPRDKAFYRHSDPYHILVVHLFGEKLWVFDDITLKIDAPNATFLIPKDTHHYCISGAEGSAHLTLGGFEDLSCLPNVRYYND